MHTIRRFLFAGLIGAALLGTTVAGASAQSDRDNDDNEGDHAVFVQGNDPTANQVLAYHRAKDGTLTLAATYDAGGAGGRLMGATSDPLASQGSLRFDAAHGLLIGVNAGSNSVYSFTVDGDKLSNRSVVGSDGMFPVSVAVHGDLVYALNARGAGAVHGYRIVDRRLQSIPGSSRTLGLTPNPTATEFLTTPGDIAFTPDGRHLIVTTKASGSHIDVFGVDDDGILSQTAVMNPSTTPVPFAIAFDRRRQLVVGEAGTSSVSTYVVHADGSLGQIASASDGQVALCWVTKSHGFFFVSNTGSGTVSGFRIDASGQPTLVGNNPVGPGPIDSARTRGRFLYVELGLTGSVAELRVNADGSLSSIGTVAGHAGEEGIVAF